VGVNNIGRPRKWIVDYEIVEKLAHIQATQEEIAYTLGVTPDLFTHRKAIDPKLREALDRGYVGGKVSLRRAMFHSLEEGNVSMMKWLSIQLFHYSENPKGSVEKSGLDEIREALRQK